jgi:hypothetical protein
LFDGWNPVGLTPSAAKAVVDGMNDHRPPHLAPLSIHHRLVAEVPIGRTPRAKSYVVSRIEAEVAEAAAYGFDEVILDHNFWGGSVEPKAWLDVPEMFASTVAAG